MDDLISRQAILKAINNMVKECDSVYVTSALRNLEVIVADVPSAQPETHEKRTETHACDYINRKDAIDAHYEYCNKHPDAGFPVWSLKILKDLPSADLSGYSDKLWRSGYERGKAEPQQRWIPFKTRPLTEEEKEENPDWDRIFDCKLPEDGQAILISVNLRGHESVQYDEFYTDDGSYLDSGYEIGDEAVAWMPLPEPYKEDSE